MGRRRHSCDPSTRRRAPRRALATAVLWRARADVQAGRTIPEDERSELRAWARRAGLAGWVVDPLLDSSHLPSS